MARLMVWALREQNPPGRRANRLAECWMPKLEDGSDRVKAIHPGLIQPAHQLAVEPQRMQMCQGLAQRE